MKFVPKFWPQTPEFERLAPFDKFDTASEFLARLEAGDISLGDNPLERRELTVKMREEVKYWRTHCVLLDPAWDARHHHYISRGDGKSSILLVPNPVQQELVNDYMWHREQNIPLKLKVPKSRKHGITTEGVDLAYWETSRHENANALIMAQDDEACTEFFKILLRIHENDHPDLKPETNRSNRKELLFVHDSSVIIRPAGGREGSKGRGATPRFVMMTEASSYPRPEMQAEVYLSIQESLPTSGFYFWLDESTGRGQNGMFFEGCKAAYEDPANSDWKLFFVNWVRRYDSLPPYYPDPNITPEQWKREMEQVESSLTEREKWIMASFGATLGQIHWFRAIEKRIKAISSSASEAARMVAQEHPLTFWEAFQSASGNFFDAQSLNEASSAAEIRDKKRWVGRITSDQPGYDPAKGHWIPLTPKPSLQKHDAGPLVIWQHPLPKHKYIIGVDLGYGKPDGDWTVFSVWSRTERKFVARFRARIDSLDSVHPLRLLSKYYNDALINVEINISTELVKTLAGTDRRRYLCRMKQVAAHGDRMGTEFGWHTNQMSRPLLLGALQKALRYEPQCLTDPLMLSEMRNFREFDAGGGKIKVEGAGKGSHDDVACAGALALVADSDTYMIAEAIDKKEEDKPTTLTERRLHGKRGKAGSEKAIEWV